MRFLKLFYFPDGAVTQVWRILAVFAGVVLTAVPAVAAPVYTAPGDSVYDSHHPTLLFTPTELPDVRNRLALGGVDADAYAAIRTLATNAYPYWSMGSLISDSFSIETIPNLGLAAWVEEPFDSVAMAIGRGVTLYIADNYAPNYDEANTGLRLRALSLGYDMFFHGAPAADRARVYDEIVEYVDFIVGSPAYDVFTIQPYLGNHSAMFAAALGMAAICLDGEASPQLLAGALELCDRVCSRLLTYSIDPEGAYTEGAFYGLWTMKNLITYFHARKRWDGFDYADNPRIRAMERAFVYELLPTGGGTANNLNDCSYLTLPFARMNTYFDWAMSEWDSGLSSWIWEHSAGTYGVDMGRYADKAATVLFHRDITPTPPASVLPTGFLWHQRGLYYFRTGWPEENRSDDVLFSFYSGKYQGGHAQEDQNQFTLYAYGDKYAIDHGPGNVAKQSESHNLVFVDGAGQFNAGNSIGTDGNIAGYLLSGFADYLMGDATAAYTTHSPYNNANWPLPGSDWSWGYTGANPVLYAHRRVVVVHGPGPPYFVVLDDVDKDGQQHAYEWRLHTLVTNGIDTSVDPIVVTGDSSSMDVHVLSPDFSSLAASVETYSNATSEPDSKLIRLSTTAVDPHFGFLLFPHDAGTALPQVTTSPAAWGFATTLDWGGGVIDYVIRNDDGVAVNVDGVATDARLAVVHRDGSAVTGYIALDASTLGLDGTVYAECTEGRMGCALWGGTVEVDRYDAPYRFLDTGLSSVRYHEQELGFAIDGSYAVPDGVTGVPAPPAAAARVEVFAYPNPFNPTTSVRVRAPASSHVDVTIYDVAGRRVRRLWSGVMTGTEHVFAWDGRNDHGEAVASGAYMVRTSADGQARAAKVILLK